LNTNGLEIKQRAQQGMTFLILAFIFILAAKKLFFITKEGLKILSKIQNSNFCQKFEIFFRPM